MSEFHYCSLDGMYPKSESEEHLWVQVGNWPIFKGAESPKNNGTQAEFGGFYLLICISKWFCTVVGPFSHFFLIFFFL